MNVLLKTKAFKIFIDDLIKIYNKIHFLKVEYFILINTDIDDLKYSYN